MKIDLTIEENDLFHINETPYLVEDVSGDEITLLNKKKMGVRPMNKDELQNMLLVSGSVKLVKEDYRSKE